MVLMNGRDDSRGIEDKYAPEARVEDQPVVPTRAPDREEWERGPQTTRKYEVVDSLWENVAYLRIRSRPHQPDPTWNP
jgi:hypothetical protein